MYLFWPQELDFAIDRTDNVAPSHATAYKQFGAWIHSCYGKPSASATPNPGDTIIVLTLSDSEPVLFDLVLNTDRMSVDTCVGQIKALVARPEFAPTESSRAMLQAMALQARVRSALRANDATHDVDITIDTTALGVRLRGIVLNAAERSAVEQVAAAVSGVGDVDNPLRLMTNSRQVSASKT